MSVYSELEKNGVYYFDPDKWSLDGPEVDKLVEEKFIQSIKSLDIGFMNEEYIFVL